ncbi:LytTR family DNA-binding domain-containing protein [Nosocomiicoccus massiliensis]|uniref:LytTR family DNA-binding domain-containing protein n=1 Tax=Nosocomiicoccus massiliensis TaxID=1232430 RepID=UPI0003FD967A|nr:LytTR family DNA-binding domain-containing protein [Nosocomiicoccus massiliensis]
MKTELILDHSLPDNVVKIYSKDAQLGARILSYIDHFTTDLENLAIGSEDGVIIIKIMDIVSATIYDKSLTIYTKEDEIKTSKTLSALMKELDSKTFLQVSKSEMLNIHMIKRVEPSFSGNLVARMIYGDKVIISRRYVSKLKERLGI